MLRKLLILGLLPAVLLLGAACGGDDDDDGDGEASDPTATAAATDAPADDPTAEPTEAPTEAPTEEPMDDEPTFLAGANGITCTGQWTNLTFGSTGSFEAVFDIDESGEAGTVTVTLGGNVFGVGGGTVVLPVTVDGDSVVVDTAADFLGNAKLTFDSSGAATDAVFEAPPAFGNPASKATLQDFSFDGSALTSTVEIDFGDGSTATSAIESTCA